MVSVHKKFEYVADFINLLTLIGGLFILVSLSYDIIFLDEYHLTPNFLEMQLVICSVFMLDFFLRLARSEHKWRFIGRNWILFLVAFPMLNISQWLNIELSQPVYLLVKCAPLVRGFYGLVMLVGLLTRNKVSGLMFSYVYIVVVFTYFASLIFYTFEKGVNVHVTCFGDCLWWAWMNVTTVGASIFAVTVIGKILSVLLPSLGMMMFPVFTTYAISKYKGIGGNK